MSKLAFSWLLACAVVLGTTAPAVAAVGPLGWWEGTDHQFSISNADLVTMSQIGTDPHADGFLTTSDPGDPPNPYDIPGVNNVEFRFELASAIGFRDFQVGWFMTGGPNSLPSEYWDLSDYDSMRLSFHNESVVPQDQDPEDYAIMVNMFLNTGWTDPSWGEPDVYAENTWTWVLPGADVILDLDFANATLYGDGHNGDSGQIPRLNHVSAIGFNIGSNDPDSGAYTFPVGTEGKLCVDTAVPEPAAIAIWLLLACVGLLVTKWRRQ